MSEDKNLLEKTTENIKNHPLIVVIILISIGITGLATFTDSATTLINTVNTVGKNQQQQDEKLDQLISQCWSNEGNVAIPPPFIDVCLESKKGEVRGYVDTYNYTTEDEWKQISLWGVRQGNILKLEAIDIRQGKEIKLGDFQVKFIEKAFENQLQWTTVNVNMPAGYFPQETTLFPNSTAAEN
ncbi:hypothetical protein [Lyngbya sp. PCC 8106]|uniref:hypothetical protein n=1 Tax=Lyngbya sp. (strain PCC 8106) TaxID=313612 RepID=UPI0000EAD575|nr:hypothetical protein [Lyngbya sp. PCC 8106]EAW37635.1 hypothetical protein L8106_16599 [Lyngbya sp. PCC 8106]